MQCQVAGGRRLHHDGWVEMVPTHRPAVEHGHRRRPCRWSFGILMYELVYGFTPFRGAKRDQTFENILKRPLVFPPKPEISKPCQVILTFCLTAHWPMSHAAVARLLVHAARVCESW
jgi:serine/threonine protein kinase